MVIRQFGEKYYFYWNLNKEERNRRYLTKKDFSLIKKLAQKSYYQKIRKVLIKRIKLIEALLENYRDENLEDYFERLSPERKNLVSPMFISYKFALEKWLSKGYHGLSFEDNFFVILTNNKERVRSKSEKILADLFKDLGLAYKYECPLQLSNGLVLHPDFTFLHSESKKEIYWEHFGMMDDSTYANNALKKIDSYIRNGILPGQSLIITFESSKFNLNIKSAETLARKFLLT